MIWLCAMAWAGALDRELPGAGTTATLADGPGVVVEFGATSADFSEDLPDVPVAPRLSVAGLIEPSDAVLLGIRGGVATWFDPDPEPIGEAAATIALGNRGRTVWTGGEVGAGFGAGVTLLAAATMGVDVDSLSSIGFRLGMIVQGDGSIEQRHGIVAMYRPTQRTGVSLGVHGGLRTNDDRLQLPLSLQALVHGRIGPKMTRWQAPVRIEKRVLPIDVQEHPELQCGPGDHPTGRPPPLGQEGWCARVALNGAVKRQGPYIRWHDMLVVAERGQYTDGLRSGEWIQFDHEGNIRERGEFVLGVEEGHWVNYWADGAVEQEGDLLRGESHGRWRFHDEKGTLRVEGEYVRGRRVGRWVDFDAKGVEERERFYDDGRLVTSNQLKAEPEDEGLEGDAVDPNTPTIEGAGGSERPPE